MDAICPCGSYDGLLDVAITTRWDLLLRLLPLVFTGGFVHPAVELLRARRVGDRG